MRNVLILGGVHGNEYLSQLLVCKMFEKFSTEKYKHILNNLSVKCIPVVNPTGAINNTRDYVDMGNNDLNRYTKYQSKQEIKDSIEDDIHWCDLLIDVHNSPHCANMFLFDKIRDYSREVSLIERSDGYIHWDATSHNNKTYAKDIGNLAVTYEFSGMSTVGNDIYSTQFNQAFDDITSFLCAYNVVCDTIYDDVCDAVPLREMIPIHTNITGTMEPLVFAGGGYEKGTPLVKIHDGIHGPMSIMAPCDLQVIDFNLDYVEAGSVVLEYTPIKMGGINIV